MTTRTTDGYQPDGECEDIKEDHRMNIAVIFAGGSGQRMHSKERPKQFLLVHGKPIIVHTIEHFQKHQEIDGIVVVCLKDWIPYMEELAFNYRLDKIGRIVPGGVTGQMSIYEGLKAAAEAYGTEGTIVLIHDGVRPLINDRTISDNIACVRENGCAITCAPAKETVMLMDDKGHIEAVPDRSRCCMARAPQSFYLSEIVELENKAVEQGQTDVIDCCTLMRMNNRPLFTVEGPIENVKITTPDDFCMFRAIYDARENRQLYDY